MSLEESDGSDGDAEHEGHDPDVELGVGFSREDEPGGKRKRGQPKRVDEARAHERQGKR